MNKADFPALECPTCERPTPPRSVNGDKSVTYSCAARNHQATHGSTQTWRITEDGTFLERSDSGRYE
jgi:predicted transcriptional regulator